KRREAAIQEFADKIKEENKINGETEEILYQEGIKRGLDKKVQDRVEGYKKILILNEVNREIVKNLDKEITDKEIEDLYNENEDRYTYFHVKRITTKDRVMADIIHKRASDGEDLEKIASDHSLKVANISIRDLGFENKYKNLFKRKDVGSVIDIIETDKGFEILKIVDKTKVPVPQSKPLLKFNLLRNRRSNAIDNLRDENQIIVEIVENKEGS
ncbi:MAG: peptidyl-prolyl cis-trans isomerase, partial [Thermodesulfobacteriota bacterium]